MSAPILPQAWEDIASDVTGSIEKAVQPLLRKAVDEIYGGLIEATQDYLSDNLAFNIASRISTAEREAEMARYRCADLEREASDQRSLFNSLLREIIRIEGDFVPDRDADAVMALAEMREAIGTAIIKASGGVA